MSSFLGAKHSLCHLLQFALTWSHPSACVQSAKNRQMRYSSFIISQGIWSIWSCNTCSLCVWGVGTLWVSGADPFVFPHQDVTDWQLIQGLAIVSQGRPPLAELSVEMWDITGLGVCRHYGHYVFLQKWLPACRVSSSFFWKL